MIENKQVYLDEKGRAYIIEHLACGASLGKVSQNVHIIYQDDDSKAVILFDAHRKHSKLEASAQTLPEGTEPEKPNRRARLQLIGLDIVD